MHTVKAETVVVGTGPGGATIARELARAGEDVLVLEKGRDHQLPVGSILAYATMYDIQRSREGVLIRRGITTGGSTMIYSGNSIDPGLCDPACDRCLFGCRRGAKWTARDYLYEAMALGARVMTRCDVRKVIRSGNAAAGVYARTPEGSLVVEAGRVILAAGGLGTPLILQASGISSAGTNFFTDPMSVMVGLSSDGAGTWHEITYTFADESHVGEFVMGNVGAVNAFMAQIAALHLPYAWRVAQLRGLVGMFVKLCDEPSGRIEPDGTLHKTFTVKDEKTMAKGVEAAKAIMIRAGVIPSTISVAKGIGGHPGGTAAMGSVVDTNLMTDVENLYVCDNSVMPRSGGIPPVLTLIALGKKFARSLIKKGNWTGKARKKRHD
ncbi:MAG TPA: GMC family oxidoreductase N-terminal domain-containing protein [Deltaproteobacteria bacterium]|nr:GMC family oxidoreductase N-terminal domain-containing protein [Deltaproteobacteria bacterium]